MEKLAQYLATGRKQAGLSLRAVEATTGISNAYLSQLENGKIRQPSPTLLHKLSELYDMKYQQLLEAAGYPVPELETPNRSQFVARLADTTHKEQHALLEYLDFLRSKRRAGGK